MSYAPSTIRSVQYASGSVAVADGYNGTKTISFGTTLTDAGKAIMVQTRFGGNENGSSDGSTKFTLAGGWTITNTTTASIVVTSNNTNGAGSIKYSFYVLEYY